MEWLDHLIQQIKTPAFQENWWLQADQLQSHMEVLNIIITVKIAMNFLGYLCVCTDSASQWMSCMKWHLRVFTLLKKELCPQIIVQGIMGKWAFIAMWRQGMSGMLQGDPGTAAHPMTSRQIMCPWVEMSSLNMYRKLRETKTKKMGQNSY